MPDRAVTERLTRLESRMDTVQRDIEDSRNARERYIPIVERNAAYVDEIRADVGDLTNSVNKLNATLSSLTERIGPVLTERAIVLKALRFWGGIVVGIIATVTAGALGKLVIERLF